MDVDARWIAVAVVGGGMAFAVVGLQPWGNLLHSWDDGPLPIVAAAVFAVLLSPYSVTVKLLGP